MNAPHDHHFIPAFYLKQWADGSSGKLIEYSLKYAKLIPKPVGPRSTGYETDLYQSPELPPDMAQYLEQKFFDYADRKASDALVLQLNCPQSEWDAELRSAWSRFVIGVHLRHPDAMAELRAGTRAIWDGSGIEAQRAYHQLRQPTDPATFDEYILQRDPHIPAKAALNLIMKAIDNDIVGTYVNQMTWGVLDLSAATHRLLTSDRPVEIYQIREPNGVLAIPISPTKAFVAVNDRSILDKLTKVKPEHIVRKMNYHAVSRARRFVWANDESQSRYVQKHMSTAMEPTPLFPNLGAYTNTDGLT